MPRVKRTTYAYTDIVLAVMFIFVLDFTLLATDLASFGKSILGKLPSDAHGLSYPFSIQNLMWVLFFVSMGELLYRKQETKASRSHLVERCLPTDDENTVLQLGDLTPIFSRVRDKVKDEVAMLPRLIYHAILYLKNSISIESAANLVNTQMEYLSHQLDLRYTMLRYLIWLIPTLGFIGTVYGIAIALAGVSAMDPNSPDLLKVATQNLAVAFDTTLLALIQSAILVYIMHVTQEKEEHCLNLSGLDCLNNFVNRIYIPKES